MRERPPRRLLEAEAGRRDAWQQALGRSVLASFVVDQADAEGAGRFAIRRLDVYRATALQLRIRLLTTPFCSQVYQVVVNLGAIAIQVGNRALFRGVHRRDICPAQAAAEASELRRGGRGVLGRAGGQGKPGSPGAQGSHSDYEELLAAEGMPAELGEARLVDVKRASINGLRIAKATDAFWEVDQLHAILRLYMEGCSIRDIVARTGLSRKVVWNRLRERGLSAADE